MTGKLAWVLWGWMLIPGMAHADAMRCGSRLVTPGDTKAEVHLRCGEPDFKTTVKLLKQSAATATSPALSAPGEPPALTRIESESIIPIDEWTYNPGAGQFLRILTFRGNILESVRFGEKSVPQSD